MTKSVALTAKEERELRRLWRSGDYLTHKHSDELVERLLATLDSTRRLKAKRVVAELRHDAEEASGRYRRPEVEPVRIVLQGDGSTIEIRHFAAEPAGASA